MEYDEQEAIAFIRNYVGDEVSSQFDDDDITLIIDIIWDYYESKGYLSVNKSVTDEECLREDELIAYVRKEIKNDRSLIMDPDDIGKIVKAELEYEESIEDAE